MGRLALGLVENKQWLWSHTGALRLQALHGLHGEDPLGAYEGLAARYALEQELALELRLKLYGDFAVAEAEALRDFSSTALADSFVETTFNAPVLHLREGAFLLYSWGLKDAQESYPGGEWPEVHFGKSPEELPHGRAFAPLALYDEEEHCLVVSPLSHFLISPLRLIRTPLGPAVARGLHGSVAAVPRGTVVKTLLVFGRGLIATLYAWGDLLLKLGRKRRIEPWSHPLLSRLGYWNAYGSYYTELLHPMNERILLALARDFQIKNIPVGYFGLDLWYEFEEIGLAKSYRPSAKKFPRGLKALQQKTGRPFVLHLSAFSRQAFSEGAREGHILWGKQSACPVSRAFYRRLARQLKQEGAIAAWHDWLRTQQHLVPALRSQLEAADSWFASLCTGLSDEGLPLMLCMPTMGFHLASTQHSNVIAARSYTDYLFKVTGAVARLKEQGLEMGTVTRQAYLKNELWLGLLLHALGLLPFHDVFISHRRHPQGFAEPQAVQEAWWRLLSAGPVGFGDKVGEADVKLLKRLVLPDGLLAKPDRPLWPLAQTLHSDVWVAYTESRPEEGPPWLYLTVLNIGHQSRAYLLEPSKLLPLKSPYLVYDPVGEQIVSAVQGRLSSGEAHLYVLVPQIAGVVVVGFPTLVPAPSSHVRQLLADSDGVRLDLRLQPGLRYELRAWSNQLLELRPGGGAASVVARAPTAHGLRRWEIQPHQQEVQLMMLK